MDISGLMQAHRSIRTFRDQNIPAELVERILTDAVAGASSSGNLNSVSMILTRDPERRRSLFELHGEQEMILEAPLVITFCADWHRTRSWLRQRGARDNFNNLLGYLVGSFDAMILAQNVCLGFEANGLGICYMGTTLFELEKIAELLELPETVAPVTTIVVGYPNEAPSQRDRLPLKGLVFEERYTVPSEAEIDEIFRERDVRGWARYMANGEQSSFAQEQGITNLAQFYTSKIKYDPDYFVPCSSEIQAFLKRKGFLPADPE